MLFFLCIIHNFSSTPSDDGGVAGAVLACHLSLEWGNIAFHFEADLGICTHHIQFVALCGTVEIEGQSLLFHLIAVIHWHDVWLVFIHKPYMYNFTLV